jgi:hypothetical protein
VDGGQLIVLSGAVLGVGDDVVVVVMRSWSWYRGRGSADGGSAGWPVSMASSLAVRISGEVSRSRCVHRWWCGCWGGRNPPGVVCVTSPPPISVTPNFQQTFHLP